MLNINAIQSHKVSEREVEQEFLEPYGAGVDKVHRRRVRETVLAITKNDGETIRLYGEQADRARSIIEDPENSADFQIGHYLDSGLLDSLGQGSIVASASDF